MERRRKAPPSQRSAKSSPDTQIQLQFVNVVPTSTGKDKRAETLHIIRANAAHFHWRHNRPPHDKWKTKQSTNGVPKRPEPLKHGFNSTPSSEESSSPPDDSPTDELYQLPTPSSSSVESAQSGSDEKDPEMSPITLLTMDTTYLGHKVDPFSSCASDLPPEFVGRCIRYSKRLLSPILAMLTDQRRSSHSPWPLPNEKPR